MFHNGSVTFRNSFVTLRIVQLAHGVVECIFWRGGNDVGVTLRRTCWHITWLQPTDAKKCCDSHHYWLAVTVQSYGHTDSPWACLDLKVSACWWPAMDYISTIFGVDSSSHFPFRAQTDKNSHNWSPIQWLQLASIINPLSLNCWISRRWLYT